MNALLDVHQDLPDFGAELSIESVIGVGLEGWGLGSEKGRSKGV